MKYKRLIAVLAIIGIFSTVLVGCGGKEKSSDKSDKSESQYLHFGIFIQEQKRKLLRIWLMSITHHRIK